MAFNYQVSLSDPTSAGGAADAVLVYDLQQALGVLSGYISGLGTLVVGLDLVQTTEAREDGGPTTTQFSGTNNGLNVFGSSALYELSTGSHVAETSTDITISVSPSYLAFQDLTPNLTYASAVANDKYNPIDLFIHELIHGLGMSGFYSQDGVLSIGYESLFDTHVQLTSNAAYFTGANAEAAYGGPVPLTTDSTVGENYYHFGDTQTDLKQTPTTVQDPLTLDLMNGIVFYFNHQYPVSALDLGVLKDLGYTVSGTVGSASLVSTGDLYVTGAARSLTVPAAGRCSRQRHQPGYRRDGGEPGAGAREWYTDAQRRRFVHLHTGGRIRRHRYVHLRGTGSRSAG